MRKILLLMLLFIWTPAHATTWVKLEEKYYFDKDSLVYYRNDQNLVEYNKKSFWIKTLNNKSKYFNNLEKEYKTKIWYILTNYIVNTSTKQVAIKATTFYSVKGDVVDSFSTNDYGLKWSPVVPDSYAELYFELAKHPRYLRKMYKFQKFNQDDN